MASSIYTKKGDQGLTSTLVKKNVSKTNIIFSLLGSLDELNAILNLALIYLKQDIHAKDHIQFITLIQEHIYFLSADIAQQKVTKNWNKKTTWLEVHLDSIDKMNPPLKSFIHLGNSMASSYLNFARTIARQSERIYWKLMDDEENKKWIESNKEKWITIGSYLNRLSDFLFVLAQYYNYKKYNMNRILD